MVLAGVAVHAARDVSPAFDKQSTPDIVALRHLAQYQQGLLAAIAETKLDRVHVTQTISLPLAQFFHGVPLTDYIRVHGATAVPIDPLRTPVNVELVEYPRRLDGSFDTWWRNRGLSAYIEAGTFRLLGCVADWETIASVIVDLFPTGPETLALATPLLLPGQPMRACVADLAAFMAVRSNVSVPDPTPSRESYLDEVTERRRAVFGQIRDAY